MTQIVSFTYRHNEPLLTLLESPLNSIKRVADLIKIPEELHTSFFQSYK